LDESTANIRAVYHICPNMHPDEVQIGQNILTAARLAGVRHFVYLSVLHPQTKKMPHHWKKLKVEELLFESALPFTILQPTAYMQNILAHRQSITEQGVFPVPYPVGSRISFVDLHDVGEVATMVLTDPSHQGATYELVGTEPLTQTIVASILSQRLKRPVAAQEIPLDDWRAGAESTGTLSPYALETLSQMFRYYAKFGLEGNPRILSHLLGRPPTSLSDFVVREMA
jgi:NAD(P)H dehydrogenase (quinone)